jgi:hypothetical protein
MSDLSIDSGSTTPVNPPIVKSPTAKADLPPLNLKKANERRGKFGKVKQTVQKNVEDKLKIMSLSLEFEC